MKIICILRLTYESAKSDPIATVMRIAKHVGVPVCEKLAEKIASMEPFDKFPHYTEKFSQQQIDIVDKLCKDKIAKTPLGNHYSK